jgi:ribosomal protein L17
MKSYIAVAPATQSQSTPNSGSSNEIPINLGTGAVGTGLVVLSVILTKLSGFVDWKEIGKQWSGSQTSRILQSENRKGQELEAEIDINQGLSDTVSQLATRGMDTTTAITKDLLHLVSDAIQTSSANAQSLQSLAKANESVNKAHEDLINATRHNTEAIQALEQAIASIPTETASILEIYASELRIALNSIDRRIEESNQIKHGGYERIEKIIQLAETRIIEQYTGTIAQLRVEIKDLEKVIKTQQLG